MGVAPKTHPHTPICYVMLCQGSPTGEQSSLVGEEGSPTGEEGSPVM